MKAKLTFELVVKVEDLFYETEILSNNLKGYKITLVEQTNKKLSNE